MSDIKTYTGMVAEEDGELVLVFDPQMLVDLGWVEGDTIIWDIRDDAIVIKKKVDNGKPFVVKFKSDTCPICVDLEPDYQAVSKLFPNVEFFDVDINEEEDLADLFIEDGVPTLYYIKGKDFKELPYPDQGFDKDSLESTIKQMLEQK